MRVLRPPMEHNAVCPSSVVGLPPPLSTDIDEIASYMRVAHAVAAERGRKSTSTGGAA